MLDGRASFNFEIITRGDGNTEGELVLITTGQSQMNLNSILNDNYYVFCHFWTFVNKNESKYLYYYDAAIETFSIIDYVKRCLGKNVELTRKCGKGRSFVVGVFLVLGYMSFFSNVETSIIQTFNV